ncbi:hypothetical protein AC623_20635 [Bacillus sp. FJAT-27231]|uniref:hypothetical protein n=1 Tax=Bacillus sp. FJAT-27231 TaxID=1679168 RepID=UPI0006718093|nr:hypothetical protein [Bacillus sp. FJAT-27231]KMY52545.1 hypothetical protein AC623_20635 [Bacillus sp. FJAT-27231]
MNDKKNIKGALISHNKKKSSLRPQVVQFNDKDPFKYSQTSKTVEKPDKSGEDKVKTEKKEIKSQIEKPKSTSMKTEKKRKSAVGKNDSVKSIKVPASIHTKLNVLGKFMDENKIYAIIEELIKTYEDTQLSERQKKQFEYMSEFLQEENKYL